MDDLFGSVEEGEKELAILKKVCVDNITQGPKRESGLGRIYFLEYIRNHTDDFIENKLKNLTIKRVFLRGSRTRGEHQELMAECHSGLYIRISRNNCSDTFQLGADMDGGKGMPIIDAIQPSSRMGADKLFKCFEAVHGRIPRYANGDCQDFAERILLKVQGKDFDTKYDGGSDEETFM